MEETVKTKVGGKLRVGLLLLSTIALLGGSIFVWLYVNSSIENQKKIEFLNVVDKTEERVQDTMHEVVERLYGLRGYVSTEQVNFNKWNNYLTVVGVASRNQGTYTFAFAPRIERSGIENYVSLVKNEEQGAMYQKYSVFPVSKNAELFPIKYMTTSDSDLGSLLGYDIGTSDTQVNAIKIAVIEDSPTITNLLHLGLVRPGNQKVGYVIMLPVYNKIDIENFPKEERKKYFEGLVGIWIFPSELISPTDISDVLTSKGVSLSVFDGEANILSVGDGKGDLKQSKDIDILGKTFRFEFAGKGKTILSAFTESLPWSTLFGLVIINIMWAATVVSILMSRQQAEMLALEATKDLRKFKEAVEGVSDLVIITDKNGVILYGNKAAEKISGFKKEYFIGKTPSLWGDVMDKDFYKRFWKTIKIEKKPFWGEVTNLRRNGERYEAEINVSPILDEKGNLLYFVGIERDLTNVMAVERVKSEFISLASHQLRTPLSAVKWFGKMLINGDAGKLTPTQVEYVEKINESNEREINLVNSLLSVSRIESGKIIVEPKPTSLHDIVSSIEVEFKGELERTGKKLSILVDGKIPEIVIDGDLVRHVYINLISNAIRYTKKAGSVRVKIFITKNVIMNEVSDNGIGIPDTEQKRVFEKFFRASNALKKETDGNGLGLYLAKTIVESSGGRIGFRSTEGKGSTFWFTLPMKIKKK